MTENRANGSGDWQIDGALVEILAAKGRKGLPVAQARTQAVQNASRWVRTVLERRDTKIAELEQELETTLAVIEKVPVKEGEAPPDTRDLIAQIDQGDADYEKLLEENVDLEKERDAARAEADRAVELARRVLRLFGHEDVDESIERYEIRRLAERVIEDDPEDPRNRKAREAAEQKRSQP